MAKLDKTIEIPKSATDPLPLLHWMSPTRVYSAWLEHDLLGELVLVTQWGGRHNMRGGSKMQLVATLADGMKRLDALDRRRTAHGYMRVA